MVVRCGARVKAETAASLSVWCVVGQHTPYSGVS